MGHMTEFEADDGVHLRVYRAEPRDVPRAGIVVMHEAFGMNDHIRGMCDRYANEGYLALAPALYDRVEKAFELPGYSEDDLVKGMNLRRGLEWDRCVSDMRSVIEQAREAGSVGVVGFCWGGSLAWLAATRCGVDAAVCYYGGQIVQFIDEPPGCPILAHFAERDVHVPIESASVVAERYPEVPVYTYDANHGFNCDARADYDADSAALAQERTFAFFTANLANVGLAASAGE